MGTGKKVGIAIAVVIVGAIAIGQKMLVDKQQQLVERNVLVQSGIESTCRVDINIHPPSTPEFIKRQSEIVKACKKVYEHEDKWNVTIRGIPRQYQ